MTGDGTHTYQWGAEDRMVSVDGGSTVTQKYNALGQRVERFLPNGSWTFDYQFSAAGEELGVYSAGTAAWFDQDISMGGRILVDYGSPTRFLHGNNLGTTTVTTDQTGTELQDQLFYPWGQQWTLAGQPYMMHFAGMQNFEDPGLVYPTDFRKYNPALGRWMTPDPLGGDVTNPQSLNRYAYVTNNPTTLTDPLGLNSFNPADNCSYASYYYSHARCGGPPPDSGCGQYDNGSCGGDPTCDNSFGINGPINCGGSPAEVLGFPIGGNGSAAGGGAPPSAPPAGQPPMRGGPSGNPWVSPTLTPPESVCSKYGIPNLGGLGKTDMPCFYILVTTSATFGGAIPNIPGPGPRVGNAGIVPTHKYWDFIGCEISALSFLPGSDTGGALAVVDAAAVWAVLKGGSALYPATAVGANLIIALEIREACVQQVYGPGHF